MKTYDSAMASNDDGERARRTAFAALTHTHEKVGDHWQPKEENGPSDEQAAGSGVHSDRPTMGGVDANASTEHLYGIAQDLGVPGGSSMNKDELVDAISRTNTRETAKARTKKS